MADDTSAETDREDGGLRRVWKLLSAEERREFWKYAGQHARKLSHDTASFTKLCAAISAAESNKQGAPVAVRPLTSDELRLGIGRLKGRLLDQPDAQPFLADAVVNWAQGARREAFNAVLQPPAVQAPEAEDTTSSDPPTGGPITIEAGLKAIRHELSLLAEHLAAAMADISADKIPDLHAAFGRWSSVCRQHAEAERTLGVSSNLVAELEAALARRSEVALVVSDLARCHAIEHIADPGFAGCAVIRAKCDELTAMAEARQALNPSAVRAASALLRLVESGDDLDDERAARFAVEVEELFGKSVATAALRGKLRFEASMAPSVEVVDDPIAEAEPAPATEADTLRGEVLQAADEGGQPSMPSSEAPSESTIIAAPEPMSLQLHDEPVPIESGHVQEDDSAPTEAAPSETVDAGVVAGEEAPAYESFSSFCSTHWVDSSCSVVPAPWKAEAFVRALARRAREAWASGHPDIAYLFARGVVAAGGIDPLGIDDLDRADKLLSDPASQDAGVDGRRMERLRRSIADPAAGADPAMGLALMLEALRPTHPCSLAPPEIDALLGRASYSDPALNEVVRFLLQGWSAQSDPLGALRAHLLEKPSIEAVAIGPAGQRLLSGSFPDTADRLCAALFAAVMRNAPQPNMLRLKAGYLINHADVIRYLDPKALSRPGIARNGIFIPDFENSPAVSALMLDWHANAAPDVNEDSELRTRLRDVAADRDRRDILASLSSTDVLQSHERTRLHRYALELGDQAFGAARELERLWRACHELGAPTEAQLKAIVEEAKTLTSLASRSMTLRLLLLEWLKHSVALATVQRELAAKALLDLALEKPGDIAVRVANHFDAGDYRAGVALFHGGTVPSTNGVQ